MGMMIIRHKVRDYGQWRPIFDAHAEMQRAAGLSNARVYHSADSNKSEIVVVFDTEDTKKAKDFAASADLKETMAKSGVWTRQLPKSLRHVAKRGSKKGPRKARRIKRQDCLLSRGHIASKAALSIATSSTRRSRRQS